MDKTELKEAIKAIGGLSPRDRQTRGILELVELAGTAVPAFREAVAGRHGSRGVSRWLEAVIGACQNLREANGEAALGFLLRKGVQTLANDWYQAGSRQYEKYCAMATSTSVAEWYNPLYHGTLPTPVERGDRFTEGKITGEDSSLRNIKFGRVESFERELFDDDQTGQIGQRAQKLGESMTITKSIWCIFKFIGSARTYGNLTVPASDYSTVDVNGTAVTTPFSTTLYGASAGNRPSTYVTLNIGHLKTAIVATKNALDPLKNKILVNPNTLLVSNQDDFHAKLLTAPGQYPGIPGQSDAALANNPVLGGTSATAGTSQGVYAGFPGSWYSKNPFADIGLTPVTEPYAPDWFWAVMERGKGFVLQQRDPMEITQETPNSGAAFDFDAIRYRVRERFAADWVAGGARFAWLGNDGSVTGNQ